MPALVKRCVSGDALLRRCAEGSPLVRRCNPCVHCGVESFQVVASGIIPCEVGVPDPNGTFVLPVSAEFSCRWEYEFSPGFVWRIECDGDFSPPYWPFYCVRVSDMATLCAPVIPPRSTCANVYSSGLTIVNWCGGCIECVARLGGASAVVLS